MGHRDPSADEPSGHFSMAAHADEWAEALGEKAELMEMLGESLARTEWAAMSSDERFSTAFKAFKHGNPKQPTHRIYQNALMEVGYTTERRKADAMARFIVAKNAKVGDKVHCPGCNAKFKKATYQHTFCKEKRKDYSNCKDFINNWFSTKRLARTMTRIGPQPKHRPKLGTPEVHDNGGVSMLDEMKNVPKEMQDIQLYNNAAELKMVKKWLADGTISKEALQGLLG